VRRIAVLIAALAVAVVLIPYAIAPFYRFIDPVSTPMLWRKLTGGRVIHSFVPLDRMSLALPITVIMAEDGSFCRNRGIDLGAMREAMRQTKKDGEARGASTLTQQTAKNLFLWQGRSYVRKALEIPLALWINLVLPKRRILEIYLNIAQWGPNGEFGAEAGAQWAFGKSARDITGHEAAELAAILPNPVERSARKPGAIVRQLAGIYERRAADFGARDACIRTP
jgi:monofunctional biosynthetic peptidoglycan transglycosylase